MGIVSRSTFQDVSKKKQPNIPKRLGTLGGGVKHPLLCTLLMYLSGGFNEERVGAVGVCCCVQIYLKALEETPGKFVSFRMYLSGGFHDEERVRAGGRERGYRANSSGRCLRRVLHEGKGVCAREVGAAPSAMRHLYPAAFQMFFFLLRITATLCFSGFHSFGSNVTHNSNPTAIYADGVVPLDTGVESIDGHRMFIFASALRTPNLLLFPWTNQKQRTMLLKNTGSGQRHSLYSLSCPSVD